VGLVVFVAAVGSVVALELALHKTWFGRSVRALMQDRYAGRLVGIHVERTARLTFGLGIAFAGAAGGLLAMLYSFSPDFGGTFLLRAFVIIVLGGLESFSGVAIGALILALVETFSIMVIPAGYQPAIAFSLLVVALIVLPGGVASLLQKRQRLA
jgi:branched-chain amino acid transport system permease protein